MKKVDLSQYSNPNFKIGRNYLVRILWYYINSWVFHSAAFPSSRLKVILLRTFGAKIGKAVVIKPNVNVKYPWKLSIGSYSWIGEGVWIDNLDEVAIGESCCLSQGAMILTGNHDYKKERFDLIIGKVSMSDGSWIGAKSMVCPGVSIGSHAVLSVCSTANRDLEAYTIYQGNPAVEVKKREIK